MNITTSSRGFRFLEHSGYLPPHHDGRVVSESSAIGDYADSLQNPGSSYLWFGEQHHLNREQVRLLVACLEHWLEHKRLPEELGNI